MSAGLAVTRPVGVRAGLGVFAHRVLVDQATIGAVAPTSPTAARALTAVVPSAPGAVVVELGAGTGAISAAVGPRLGAHARHVALERDPELLRALGRAAPWADRVVGDARHLHRHLAELGLGPVDAVVSSLPWGNFAPELQVGLVEQVTRAMTPDGVFATLVYRPTRLRGGGRRFRALLAESFDEVMVSSTVWANLPPARMYVCRRPRVQVTA